MSSQTYIKVLSFIFTLIALLHLARLAYGWQAQIGDWAMPTWVSWVALVVAGYLAYSGFRLAGKK